MASYTSVICMNCGGVFSVMANSDTDLEGQNCPACGSDRLSTAIPWFFEGGG
jgi:DNA-directed RNA polymerase subunit RPC12/RpoP